MERIEKTDEEWRRELTPEQYHVLRMKGTERPGSGEYLNEETEGVYTCAACGYQLFSSDAKYHSGCGWPAFFQPIAPDAVEEERDTSFGMLRTEVHCPRCGGHLGHVFEDGPAPTGQRYCINSVSIKLEERDAD